MPSVEPGPLPTGTGEALRCCSFLGVPEISLRWEGIFQGWQCRYFLVHSSLGHSACRCTSWTDRGSEVSLLRSCGTEGLRLASVQHRRGTMGPLAQPPSKCWSGLCPLTPVPPVLGSSVGKVLQEAWDRIWQEAINGSRLAVTTFNGVAGPTSAPASLLGRGREDSSCPHQAWA